ncbi:RNA-guided endonuclease IscB [Ferrovum sp.]|uniref:RNA-guided endonuclease IscB n=1 Tax=Ferrovum sp. TaxID=2609467 RepID=UPI002612B829|nr:RNA-guided endonuclease IscB [Ferrovum sp.]
MMQRVLILDKNRQPLMPCHPARARELLREGKAAVFRRFPFAIILKGRTVGVVQDVRLKLDPGSKVTGMALVATFARRGPTVVWAGELTHRGAAIRKALERRRGHRRFRRARLRYREPRFLNRTRSEGWLAPSLQHRIDTTMAWVKRLQKWCPVSGIAQELVRFDMQVIENPEISGIEYQQGTLAGYEVREYLLEKWGRKCAYCGAEHVPLEIDHIHPKSKGGSDRVSNLTIACHGCNQAKGNSPIEQFLAKAPERARGILAQTKTPLRDAAAVNSTRWALYQRLKATNLPVEVASGGRTKWNRTRQGYAKAHWIDAACIGPSAADVLLAPEMRPIAIQSFGHGERQRARLNRYGFPVWHKAGAKSFLGFQTGDLVRAIIPNGKHTGVHIGRVAIRFRPSFAVKAEDSGKAFDVHPKHLTTLQRSDGYAYH